MYLVKLISNSIHIISKFLKNIWKTLDSLFKLIFYVQFLKRNDANVAFKYKCMVFNLITTSFIDFNAHIFIQCRK